MKESIRHVIGIRFLFLALLLTLSGCGNLKIFLNSTVNPLSLPDEKNPSTGIVEGDTVTLQPTGGTPPYVFEIVSGGGTISSGTGELTPPAAPAVVVVKVTDASGKSIEYPINIDPPLSFDVLGPQIAQNNSYTFTAKGGIAPLSYSIISGGGWINPVTGAFEPRGALGPSVVEVRDSLGHVLTNTITVHPSLSMTPANHNMWTLTTQNFVALGGVPPYFYSVLVGGGSVGSVDGFFQAGATSGSTTLMVTDSLGNAAVSWVTVTQGVVLNPASKVLAVGNEFEFTASGGPTPYTFEIVSGPGSMAVSSSSAKVTATAVGSTVLRVTDAAGNKSEAQITVNGALQIAPSIKNLAVNNTYQFSASGGVGVHTYSAVLGMIDAQTGYYVAPGSAGSDTVTVTDSLGNTAQASVTINPALQISPAIKTLAVNNTAAFSASDGVGPYTFSASAGTINASTGAFTAPLSSQSVTITVTDSLGNTSQATVTVNPALSASASPSVIAANNFATVSATGGVSPYTYTQVSGPGTINSSNGKYTPGASGAAVLQVIDSLGNTATVSVTVNSLLSISPATPTVLLNSSQAFTATGGVTPYSYSLQSGEGSIHSVTGIYTAPGSVGSAVVLVTDSLGNTSSASVNIVDCVPGSQAFSYTGGAQTFIQRPGCTKVTIKAWGAGGGGTVDGGSGVGYGGGGGYASGEYSLAPGSQLSVFVGGAGIPGLAGGWNGGGVGYSGPGYDGSVGSGGGASDVRVGGVGLANRILVAGGGGGGLWIAGNNGGAGGGLTGQNGSVGAPTPAGGGTQVSGGAGAYTNCGMFCGGSGFAGSLGQGGSNSGGSWGGAGGGGYYGGGNGVMNGGGGGSSYIGGVSNGQTWGGSGVTPGNSGDADRAGAGAGGGAGGSGSHGRIVIYYSL